MNKIKWTLASSAQYKSLEDDPSCARILKDVRRTLAHIERDLRHPSLNTHEYEGLTGANSEKVFEAYAQ